MALIKCKECGAQVSSKAKTCPSCGTQVARKPMGCGTFIGVLILGAIVIGLGTQLTSHGDNGKPQAAPAQPPTPEQLAAKKKKDEAVGRAQVGALELKKAMRDPDSFKLEQAVVMESGAVCYEYRAKNGFGGMNVGHAVISADGNTFKSNGMDGFAPLWNKACANQHGDDVADALNWMTL